MATDTTSKIETTREAYMNRFKILSASAVGVILTRTKEPFLAIDALREVAQRQNQTFREWNCADGWLIQEPGSDPNKPTIEPIQDPIMGIKRIVDMDGGGQNKWEGVFAMHALHPWLSTDMGQTPNPVLVEILRRYVWQFSERPKQRLVLVVPEQWTLPPDLANDIPILDYGLPGRDELVEVFETVVESSCREGEEITLFNQEEMDQIINSASGMTVMQAETAFSEAVVVNGAEWPSIPLGDFNPIVMRAKTDIVKQSDILEMMDAVPIDKVGGLDILKDWITETGEVMNQDAIDFGCDRAKGVVMIGPPGTGKSLCAKAIASILGRPLVKFDVGRVFNSLIGKSEERVRAVLDMAEAMAPCVLFLDELDKGLGGAHNAGGDSGVSGRILGAILTHMQECTADIFYVATANRTAGLPPELLRKGRFDEVWAVMPPNRTEREAIFDIHLRGRKQQPISAKDMKIAVAASVGYVSAEIEAAVKEAVKKAYLQKVRGDDGAKVTGDMLAEELANMNPISLAFADDFNHMKEWAENNARWASTQEDEEEIVAKVTTSSTGVGRRRRRAVHTSD